MIPTLYETKTKSTVLPTSLMSFLHIYTQEVQSLLNSRNLVIHLVNLIDLVNLVDLVQIALLCLVYLSIDTNQLC